MLLLLHVTLDYIHQHFILLTATAVEVLLSFHQYCCLVLYFISQGSSPPYMISHAWFHCLIPNYNFLMFLQGSWFQFCILCHNYQKGWNKQFLNRFSSVRFSWSSCFWKFNHELIIMSRSWSILNLTRKPSFYSKGTKEQLTKLAMSYGWYKVKTCYRFDCDNIWFTVIVNILF